MEEDPESGLIAIYTYLNEKPDPGNKYYLQPNTDDSEIGTVVAKTGSRVPLYIFILTRVQ